jgi:hypothetical protein
MAFLSFEWFLHEFSVAMWMSIYLLDNGVKRKREKVFSRSCVSFKKHHDKWKFIGFHWDVLGKVGLIRLYLVMLESRQGKLTYFFSKIWWRLLSWIIENFINFQQKIANKIEIKLSQLKLPRLPFNNIYRKSSQF